LPLDQVDQAVDQAPVSLVHSAADLVHPAAGVDHAPPPSSEPKTSSSRGVLSDARDAAPRDPPPLDPALESAIRGALPPGATPSPADLERWRDAFEERAAVLEVDGGLNRAEAERQAFEFVVSRVRRDAAAADGDPPHA